MFRVLFMFLFVQIFTLTASAELVDLREVQNPAGVKFDASQNTRIYAEDYQRIKEAIQNGAAEINTMGIRLQPQSTDLSCQSGIYELFSSDASDTVKVCDDGRIYDLSIGGMLFGGRAVQLGGTSFDGSALRTWGLHAGGVTSNNCSGAFVAGGLGSYTFCDTTSTTGSEASVELNATPHNMGARAVSRFIISFRNSINDVRFFCGFTNQIVSTMISNDNPAGAYFGLTYSTNRPDLEFQYVVDDGTTQTLIPSTVTPLLNTLYGIYIVSSPISVTIAIMDNNGKLLDSHTFTENLPTDTTFMRPAVGIENLGSASTSFRIPGFISGNLQNNF